MFRRIVSWLLVMCLFVQPCFAWSESGHHLIGVLAFDLMPADKQAKLLHILKAHPRLADDFKLPTSLNTEADKSRWVLGHASYWPDIARSQPKYNRPTWHYQLGSALTVGRDVNVPATPGQLPPGSTLKTEDLYIAQAVELCRRILQNEATSDADKALAICWIGHLVGDAHQPCHAGSLYCETVFPDGDRGANSIKTKQGRNLHALWDGLFGSRFDLADTRRRAVELRGLPEWNAAGEGGEQLDPSVWLAESVEYARSSVYTEEVLAAVEAARRSGTMTVEQIDLSESYLKKAGAVAQQRAVLAAHRLAKILDEDLP